MTYLIIEDNMKKYAPVFFIAMETLFSFSLDLAL